MKTSEVLRRVRIHLSDGTDNPLSHRIYICYALNYLYFHAGAIGDRDRQRVTKIIEAALHPACTLEHWLLINHDIPLKRTKPYRRKIMATRKAWLDHLIEHYEAKGD